MPRVPGAASSSPRGKGHVNEDEDGGRYTADQVAILEYLYQGCTKPNHSERQSMIRKYSALATMESNQIKIWFLNRRTCDKGKRVSTDLHEVNKQLLAANQLLGQENDRLEKVVRRLVSEKENMRHHKENAETSTSGTKVDSNRNSHQFQPEASSIATRLIFLAERTLAEFLSKATGGDVDWVPIPGMKTRSDSIRLVSILHNSNGTAARACCHVPLDPAEVMKILKDYSSWFRDCRKMDSYVSFPSNRKGIIELIYMQLYALTTLTSAHDLLTLRYTTTLEDGSLVVCQRSTSGSGAVPTSPAKTDFQRAKMLASGYLIQPYVGGGSIVTIVDHFDFEEASSVTEVLQPIYWSSNLIAQRMTVAALDYIVEEAEERSGKLTYSPGPFMKQPAVIRSFSIRLSRVFNNAINGFTEDNWLLINHDPAENLIVSTKTTKNFSTNWNCSNALPSCEGILCVKASMLLENVSPMLVQFLKDHRSDWWEFKVDAHAESLNYRSLAFPGVDTHFCEDGVQLGNGRGEDEILEVIRLKGQTPHQNRALPPQNVYLLQMSNGLGESTVGPCSELIFAPMIKNPPDDPLLLASGFRILSLDSVTGKINGQAQQTMNLASGSAGPSSLSTGSFSVLIVAFQFPFESHLLDYVANMAQKYVSNVLSYVRNVGNAMTPSRSIPHVEPDLTSGSPTTATLATDICQSYRLWFGEELLRLDALSGEVALEHLLYHKDAIFCWSLKPVQICLFANQAAYNMLDASLVTLHDVNPDQIFGQSLQEGLSTVMKQGYAILTGGICMSLKRNSVRYNRLVMWTVEEGAGAPKRLAFAFRNWSK